MGRLKWFIDNSAPAEGDGKSWESPFKTIEYAMSVMEHDDILVGRGGYFVSAPVSITKGSEIRAVNRWPKSGIFASSDSPSFWIAISGDFGTNPAISLNSPLALRFSGVHIGFGGNTTASCGIQQTGGIGVCFENVVFFTQGGISSLPSPIIRGYNPPSPQGGYFLVISNSVIAIMYFSPSLWTLIESFGNLVITDSLIVLPFNCQIRDLTGNNVFPFSQITKSVFLIIYASAQGQSWDGWNWIYEETDGITFAGNTYLAFDFSTSRLEVLTSKDLPVGAKKKDVCPLQFKVFPQLFTPFRQPTDLQSLRKLIVYSKTENNETIPAVLHSIFSDDNVFITSKLSDDEGKSVFSLMPGNFEIRTYKTGYHFPPQVITVGDTDITATVTGSSLSYTPSPSPTACRVHIHAVDLGLSPVSGILVEVNYDLPEKVGDKIGAGRIRKLYTDSEGHTYFDAPQGSMVKVIIPLARIDQVVRIPVDKVAVSITELLTFR